MPDLSNWHLFGVYASDVKNLPSAQINLSLNGILYSTDPNQSRAFLSIPGQMTKAYKLGDTITGTDIVIKEILPRGVILIQSGQLLNLSLPEPALNMAPPPSSGRFQQ